VTTAVAPEAELAQGAAELTRIVAQNAPGCAGQPDGWAGSVGAAVGVHDVPSFWRLGVAAVDGVEGAAWPLAVPLLDYAHLAVRSDPETRPYAEGLVQDLVLRVLSYFQPGTVRVRLWDVARINGPLPGLMPLTRGGLLTVHDPSDLTGLLGELSRQIQRVHGQAMVSGHTSLAEMAQAAGERIEPWTLAVLFGDCTKFENTEAQQLQRIMHDGLAAGVCVVLVDVPQPASWRQETIDLTRGRSTMTNEVTSIYLDPALPHTVAVNASNAIADEWERMRVRSGDLDDLLPEQWGMGDSSKGLMAPVGFSADGRTRDVMVHIGDQAAHWLICGDTGTGKSNLLHAMIMAFGTRYPPSELHVKLFDFKEGVSFAPFAPGYWNDEWLPHADLIGVNINEDRIYGLELLRRLAQEIRRRGDAARAFSATDLAGLRAANSDGGWPRIVSIVDEFQVLFEEDDAIAREVRTLLATVLKHGRSFGVHLLFATQDLASIATLAGFKDIFKQFVGRIAMQRGDDALDDLQEPAKGLLDWHVIVNHRRGVPQAHEVARIPHAPPERIIELQHQMHGLWADTPPQVMDGDEAPDLSALSGSDVGPVLGQYPDDARTPVAVPLPDRPGRNIAVLGGEEAARPVLDVAAMSLAAHDPTARHILVPLAGKPLTVPVAHEVVPASDFPEWITKFAQEVDERGKPGGSRSPIYLVIWGVDLAYPVLDEEGIAALRLVLHYGPALGVHVIGWWHSVGRLQSLLSETAAEDDVGVLVALDIPSQEFGRFIEVWSLEWTYRPGQALFFDRNGGRREPDQFRTPRAVEQ
jgi:S-DNA-T family DNA segregation ATPase FtsK/SpoIIIE